MKFRNSGIHSWFWFAGLVLVVATALAGPKITLSWYSDPYSDVAGHKILCGLQSREYTSVFDVGNVTYASITLPDGGSEYYLAVVAYNADGLESEPSEEVIYTPPGPPRMVPIIGGGNEFTVTWNSIPGTGYRILHKPRLEAGTWSPVSRVIVADGSVMQWATEVDPGAESAFFRVQVIPSPNAPPLVQLASANSSADVRLTWKSVPGKGYRVLHKRELSDADWTPVSVVMTAEDTFMEWLTQADKTAPSGFYQLEVIEDPEALPVTTISFTDDQRIRLSWTAVPGRRYQVCHKTDFADPEWVPVGEILVAESQRMEWTTPIDLTAPSGFFLVRLAPE